MSMHGPHPGIGNLHRLEKWQDKKSEQKRKESEEVDWSGVFWLFFVLAVLLGLAIGLSG